MQYTRNLLQVAQEVGTLNAHLRVSISEHQLRVDPSHEHFPIIFVTFLLGHCGAEELSDLCKKYADSIVRWLTPILVESTCQPTSISGEEQQTAIEKGIEGQGLERGVRNLLDTCLTYLRAFGSLKKSSALCRKRSATNSLDGTTAPFQLMYCFERRRWSHRIVHVRMATVPASKNNEVRSPVKPSWNDASSLAILIAR